MPRRALPSGRPRTMNWSALSCATTPRGPQPPAARAVRSRPRPPARREKILDLADPLGFSILDSDEDVSLTDALEVGVAYVALAADRQRGVGSGPRAGPV